MKKFQHKTIVAAFVSLGLLTAMPTFAEDTALPAKPQTQSEETVAVQSQVDQKTTQQAEEKRKKITAEAVAAVVETEKALKLLGEKKTDEALASLERATGKLELILQRDPNLSFAPISVDVVTYDLMADLDTIKAVIKEAANYLEDGEIQKVRPLIANLASEIIFRTTSIPLATYPDAIKAIAPLIDAGKIDEAKVALQVALNTLIITEEAIPLPVIRAENLLMNAEALAENNERTEKDDETLKDLLDEAKNQLMMAEILGYGNKKAFKPMYEQIKEIKKKATNGKGGKGWFDKIKQQLSDLI